MLRSRTFSLTVLVALLLVLAACGSSAASEDGGDGGDGSEASQAETAPPDDGDGSDGDGSDGDGSDGDDNGQGGSFDLEAAFDILTPPNATELSKTTAEGVIFAAWDSSDSFDTLRSFYENAIDEAGFQVISTTEAQGGIAWVVAVDDSSSVGGSVSLFPASDGSGTQVAVTIGEGA